MAAAQASPRLFVVGEVRIGVALDKASINLPTKGRFGTGSVAAIPHELNIEFCLLGPCPECFALETLQQNKTTRRARHLEVSGGPNQVGHTIAFQDPRVEVAWNLSGMS